PGGTLTTTAGTGVLSRASEPYGRPLTATVIAPPAHGTLTLNSDGSFAYVADAGFTGADSFSFSASDGGYTTAETLVTIQIDGSEFPTASTGAPLAYAVPRNQILSPGAATGLLSRAFDPYGETLTARLVPNTGPLHGTLSVNPDGSFTYAPAHDYTG